MALVAYEQEGRLVRVPTAQRHLGEAGCAAGVRASMVKRLSPVVTSTWLSMWWNTQAGGRTVQSSASRPSACPMAWLAPEQLGAPFTSDDWLYVLKFDGYRCMACIEAASEEPLTQQMLHPGERVRWLAKTGTDCTTPSRT